MKVITPNCRVQFTAQDVEFITEVLGKKAGQKGFLSELLADETSRDLLLDQDALLAAFMESRNCLRTSIHLYFYVLVRHALRKAGIQEREVADYVAEVLAEYSQQANLRLKVPSQPAPIDYFYEMIGALDNADEATRFRIRAHMGNQSLFLTGVFPERIRHRRERRGFPDLQYYAALGRSSFREASHHRLAERYHLSEIFDNLAGHFEEARRALNDLADRALTLGDNSQSIDALLRRVSSLS
ncbi:MAG: hypothetical protein HYR88_16710 [Verrucomicrobia bacterium]|nr:hypothetical protein [Verrucomicrobiota bacterium]MBI3868877.1 hypothetical protein [Verrucomicrobiota bacterium]